MASASLSMDVEEEVTCPICIEYMTDPVSVDCGHNFCRSCIANCCEAWEGLRVSVECPLCKAKIKKENFRPNWSLANIVEKIKGLSFKTETGAMCERHHAALNLFCKEDAEFVCVRCERSPEHRSHTVLLLEDAAEEYKGQFWRSLKTREKEREKILAYEAATEKESQDLLAQTKAARQKAVVEFRQLRKFLDEQENHLLAQMEEVEMEIARRRDELLARLSGELSSLNSLIQEMKEKCQQPPGELLQDVRGTLQRCEKRKTFEDPVAFPPARKWRHWEICDIHPFLEDVIKQFKETLESGLLSQKANVTLDPDTAQPELILSEDCKSVRGGDEYQDLPDIPERFDVRPVVLGREGFTAGRHFWDVDLGSEEKWAVGVARKTVRRKGYVDVSPEGGIWAVGKWAGEYRVVHPPHYPPLSLSQELQRIRVTLNCDEGKVAFSQADTGIHIYTYSGASFCGETLLPFFYLLEGAHLTLSP